MRLSTDPARDEPRAAAVLDAALAGGVTLLDTADAYGHDDEDIGHNESLIAAALARHRARSHTASTSAAGPPIVASRHAPACATST